MAMDHSYNRLLATEVLRKLEQRNIGGTYVESKEAALAVVLDVVPQESFSSCGGSQTLREIGLREAMKARGYNFLDPDDAETGAAKDEIAHRALGADYYLTSVNAIALTGELVNAEGYGNRVGAFIFGPKHVIVVAGVNKIVPTVDAAVVRAKTYAAQKTVMLFKQDYWSFDELAQVADNACSHLVVTSRSATKGRISVILVGERLGF